MSSAENGTLQRSKIESTRPARLLNVILPRRIAYVQSGSLSDRKQFFDTAASAGDFCHHTAAEPVFADAQRVADPARRRPIARGTSARATDPDAGKRGL